MAFERDFGLGFLINLTNAKFTSILIHTLCSVYNLKTNFVQYKRWVLLRLWQVVVKYRLSLDRIFSGFSRGRVQCSALVGWSGQAQTKLSEP